MKKFKKIIVLIVIMLLASTINVYAEEDAGNPSSTNAEVNFSTNTNTAKVGETINITLSAKCETEISGVEGILDWDKTKLEFVNQNGFVNEGFQNASGLNETTGEFNLYIASNIYPEEADMATLSFKVLETAEVDEVLSVKLSDIILYDVNLDEIEITNQEIMITIAADEQEGGEQEPGDGEQPGTGEQEPGDGEEPGTGDQEPGDGEQPGTGDQEPEGGEQTPGDIYKEPIISAGLEDNMIYILLAVVLISIVLYVKCNKYKDVK